MTCEDKQQAFTAFIGDSPTPVSQPSGCVGGGPYVTSYASPFGIPPTGWRAWSSIYLAHHEERSPVVSFELV